MISELQKCEFYKCRGLLNEHGHIEAKAIVEGVNPGRIFVDNMDSPTSGLIWLGNNDGFFFIGNERNEYFNADLNHFIDTVVLPEARKVGLTWFEGIGNHALWDETIKGVFKHRHVDSWDQRVYTLQRKDFKHNVEFTLGEEYNIFKINDTLFNNTASSIKNIAFLHSKVSAFWSSPETFFHKGLGYCAVYNDEIVCICLSGFVVNQVHCIDIETLEGHQGKKLAQNVALAFVEKCMANNLAPYWDCMESNKPSMAVAEKIGLRNVFNYKGYAFKFE
ncbi:GNAT family N-acetyltransferase [Evansella cellulosilytica]|uniref:GCN5-related N-acetyltransferase n=1 Tax=Evansella cellulosilytica (strain ATCC 21833 / DSM 2522 / FERM P-1141 / JCM 9156 / N-4) TaxID=649639 RepID=E6U1G7_EVAC2|nr:GNAT family N-acetyltransferase [Evansella cellulosilytica]ADU29214.1 GCN5-related N-acetyltransferase [Evansella cellulosilytica DSM 2522]